MQRNEQLFTSAFDFIQMPPIAFKRNVQGEWWGGMDSITERYSRRAAEKSFGMVYRFVAGSRCTYCGIANDGKSDHQPPLSVLFGFAKGGSTTKEALLERFGDCRLVPCCTICNLGLGAFQCHDDNDRRRRVANWFRVNTRHPADALVLENGRLLIQKRLEGNRGKEIYANSGVGRCIYLSALLGLAEGHFRSPSSFPDWLQASQLELSEWLRGAPRRKFQYFLDMANLMSFELLPDVGDDPRGHFQAALA
ncbi:MAG: hypothetical protein MEQ84_11540 [Mesorhizobium sp.]|nr:hypothetical protein [Mesorhizobium sp.]